MATPEAPEPTPGTPTGPKRPGRHRKILFLVLGLLLTAGLAAAVVLLAPRTENPAPAQSPAPSAVATPTPKPKPPPPPEPPPTALNILLVGSDSRVNQRAAAAAGKPSNQLADSIVFLHIPANRKQAYGISLMRDLWVDIPGHGQAKINSSLLMGGLPLVTRTVESLLGQRINHTVMVDFQTFAALTDAVGGVDVNVKVPFESTIDPGVRFAAGVNRLNGARALDFVRERKAFVDGDYQRVRNQQTFLKAVLTKVVKQGVTDRATARKLATTALPHITVTPGLTLDALARLAFSFHTTPANGAVLFTLPTAGIGTSTDGQSIVLEDPAATAEIKAALRANKLSNYVAAHKLQNGN
ncbi:LCP family protein [Arthrobacter sp. Soil763]|uniref:LCP family protein n=1 Tax=Arthrobacter sp. Soil763 TaxID=1736402 RepID=UPI0009E999C1|nr:LCP family protein [Arthrobacter sp. Soil763]